MCSQYWIHPSTESGNTRNNAVSSIIGIDQRLTLSRPMQLSTDIKSKPLRHPRPASTVTNGVGQAVGYGYDGNAEDGGGYGRRVSRTRRMRIVWPRTR